MDSSSCSTSGTRRVDLVTKEVISRICSIETYSMMLYLYDYILCSELIN
jgi:hypothetical protein